MFPYTILSLSIGFILDLIFGDPYWMPHPIRLIGNLIAYLEKSLRKLAKTKRSELILGGILVLVVLVLSTGLPLLLLLLAFRIQPVVGVILQSIFCYQILAMKCLKVESMKVQHALLKEDVEGARTAVSMIVGRDTKVLSKEGIIKAAVETVAENTSDGVIAPLLFMAIGGAPLGFFYKAVNTMDSMIGYKNERYLYFGRVAAKLDDGLNFLPSRLAAVFMIVVSFLLGFDGRHAALIYKRDRRNHASPNSAQTEAVCAGAFNILLAGNAYYFGKLYEKPTIGDAVRPIEVEDIKRANRLLYGTAFLTMVVIIAVTFIREYHQLESLFRIIN